MKPFRETYKGATGTIGGDPLLTWRLMSRIGHTQMRKANRHRSLWKRLVAALGNLF